VIGRTVRESAVTVQLLLKDVSIRLGDRLGSYLYEQGVRLAENPHYRIERHIGDTQNHSSHRSPKTIECGPLVGIQSSNHTRG
jgi:hypothetical protein